MQPFAFTHLATNTHKMRGINYTYGVQSCKKINSRSHQKGGKKIENSRFWLKIILVLSW